MISGFGSSFQKALGGNGIAALLGALAVIISIRNVGPDSWALTAIVIGLGPALGLVLSLGSVTFQTRRISRIYSTRLRAIGYSIYLGRRFAVMLPVLLLALLLFIARWDLAALVVLLTALRFFRGGTSVLLASSKRFGAISLMSVAEKAVVLLWVLGAGLLGILDWTTLPWGFAVSYLVFVGISFSLERPQITRRILLVAFRSPMRVWSRSSRFGVTSLVGPIQQSDVAVLAVVADNIQAGFLGAGSRLTNALNLPGGSLASIIMPYFSPKRREKATFTFRHGFPLMIMIGFYISVLLAGASTVSWWVPKLLGSEYVEATSVVAIYLVIVCVQTFTQPLLALLQARDAEGRAMWISVFQMIGILTATACMGYYWGAVGAAFGQLVVASVCGVVALIMTLSLRKYEDGMVATPVA